MMGDEQDRGTQDFILAKPVQGNTSKHPVAQKYFFLNLEDEHLQGHMQKTCFSQQKIGFQSDFKL